MRTIRAVIAYAVGLLGSTIGPIVVYRSRYISSPWSLAACFLAFGLLLGFAIGWLVGRIALCPLVAIVFCTVVVLWIPFVLNTLGVALIALPILVAYAALVGVGANLGIKLRHGKSGRPSTVA